MNDAAWKAYEVRQKHLNDLRQEVEDARHRATLTARSYIDALDKPDGPFRDADAAVVLGLLREDVAAEAAVTTAWRDAIYEPNAHVPGWYCGNVGCEVVGPHEHESGADETDADWLENRQIDTATA